MDDDLADDRMLLRVARWFQATPLELIGLAVLLSGALVASAALWWSATSRPATPPDGAAAVGDGGLGAAEVPTSPSAGPDDPTSAAEPDPTPPEDTSATATSDQEPTEVTVHVTGAVATPGLVVLDGGARVGDAVTAAGGLTDQAAPELVNLARPLTDGEHVHVPRVGEEPPVVDGGSPDGASRDPASSDGGEGAPIDLNSASVELLQTLPGIGPAKAEAIVRHRESEGRFEVPGDLRAVPGVGEATFQQLAELITVG